MSREQSHMIEIAPTASYYAVLGVHDDAEQIDIRKQYRALALENHPDRFPSPDEKAAAAQAFKRIREAYEVLIDAEQRRLYDLNRSAGRPFVPGKQQNESGQSLADIFADVDRFPF